MQAGSGAQNRRQKAWARPHLQADQVAAATKVAMEFRGGWNGGHL